MVDIQYPPRITPLASERPWWQMPNLHINSTLGSIPFHTITLNLEEKANRAIAYFEKDFQLPGILLTLEDEIVGLLSRQRFYEVMSRPFSLELFTQRSLSALWKSIRKNTMILEANLSITTAARHALKRSVQDIYEPIIVRHEPQQFGVVDIHSLLLAQNAIHELALLELESSQRALSEEKDLAQITLRSIADGVITTDRIGNVREINFIAETLIGCDLQQIIGQPISQVFQLIDPITKQPISNPAKSVLETGKSIRSPNTALFKKADAWRDIQYSASPIFNAQKDVLGAILVFRDVTQQQTLIRRIQWQACHDALTGLTNRVEFESQLTACAYELNQNYSTTSHVLIYLDLDRFKVVNDTCGHFAGDELLRQVSHLLKSCLRDEDLLARLGGDEFGVLLKHCDLTDGKQIADRMYAAIQDFRFLWQDYVFTIGVSIGVTLINGSASAGEILKQADSACYLAKHQGRNQICFYENLEGTPATSEATPIVNRVTKALTDSQFGLFYQNIFSVIPENEPQLFASEVLIRLPDGHGDWLLPEAFLSTAERYNLMTEIDRWVIETFCRSYQRVSEHLNPEIFSINLSGSSLNSDLILSFIESQLINNQIPPEKICFEVTETMAIRNLTKARSLLQQLKQIGCRLALDDFGSGMSTFQYLRTLPVDYLKIDGSLIKDIDCDRVAREIVAAVIKIGHEMGLKTMAEWVDNDEVIRILNRYENDYLQGFILHQPEELKLA